METSWNTVYYVEFHMGDNGCDLCEISITMRGQVTLLLIGKILLLNKLYICQAWVILYCLFQDACSTPELDSDKDNWEQHETDTFIGDQLGACDGFDLAQYGWSGTYFVEIYHSGWGGVYIEWIKVTFYNGVSVTWNVNDCFGCFTKNDFNQTIHTPSSGVYMTNLGYQ